MLSWGLFWLGFVQIGNGMIMLFAANRLPFFGPYTLPERMSIYRYMLSALWVSVGTVYLVGSWNASITAGATLLAVINVFLEIVAYVKSGLPKVYVLVAVIVMGCLGLWSGVILKL